MPRVRLRALRDEGRGHPPCRPCPRLLGALRRVRVCIRIPRGPQEGRCPGVSCGLVRYAYHRRLQTLLQSRQPQHRQHGVPRPRAPLLRPNREDRRRRRQGGVCGQRCARGKAQDRRHVSRSTPSSTTWSRVPGRPPATRSSARSWRTSGGWARASFP